MRLATTAGRARDSLAAADEASQPLRALLSRGEVAALVERCDALIAYPVLPEMYPWRCVPWPLL